MSANRLVGIGAVVVALVLSSCAGSGPVATRSTRTVNHSPMSSASTKPEPMTLSDIPYATASPAERLDIHLPPGVGPFPVVVYVHGGAWMTGDKAAPEYLSGIPFLLKRGYAVV